MIFEVDQVSDFEVLTDYNQLSPKEMKAYENINDEQRENKSTITVKKSSILIIFQPNDYSKMFIANFLKYIHTYYYKFVMK